MGRCPGRVHSPDCKPYGSLVVLAIVLMPGFAILNLVLAGMMSRVCITLFPPPG